MLIFSKLNFKQKKSKPLSWLTLVFGFNVSFQLYTFFTPLDTNEIMNSTKKTKNTIFAIPAAAPATPPKPKTAAINAIIKNQIAARNIIFIFFLVRKSEYIHLVRKQNTLVIIFFWIEIFYIKLLHLTLCHHTNL